MFGFVPYPEQHSELRLEACWSRLAGEHSRDAVQVRPQAGPYGPQNDRHTANTETTVGWDLGELKRPGG